MKTFFEIHRYDAGLKLQLIPAGRRPDFIGEPAGPRSSELELADGEFAVELKLIQQSNRPVVWLGYYTYGIDRQLGARGNYCGVGIWLIDCAPISVGRLLGLLRDLTSELSQQRDSYASLEAEIERIAREIDGFNWLVPFDRVPHQFWRDRFLSGSDSVQYISMSNGVELQTVSADILRRFVTMPRKGEQMFSRTLYLPERSSKAPPGLVEPLNLGHVLSGVEQIAGDFIDAVADPIAAQNALTAECGQLRHTLDSYQRSAGKHIAELENKLVLMESSLREEQSRHAELIEIFKSLRRFASNLDSPIAIPTPSLVREPQGDLENHLIRSLREMEKLNSRLVTLNSNLQASGVGQATASIAGFEFESYPKPWPWLKIISYAALALLGVAFLGALVWLFLNHHTILF